VRQEYFQGVFGQDVTVKVTNYNPSLPLGTGAGGTNEARISIIMGLIYTATHP
jgi:hypothetical protein